MRVTKEVTFDCAHMLSGHNALCKNLHGHTYKLQVSIEGTQISTGSSADMIIDFKDLKEAIQAVVMDKFDHATLISGNPYRGEAENALYNFVTTYGLRFLVLPKRTTAEDMAEYIKQEITKYLQEHITTGNISEVFIRLFETPTSYAEV